MLFEPFDAKKLGADRFFRSGRKDCKTALEGADDEIPHYRAPTVIDVGGSELPTFLSPCVARTSNPANHRRGVYPQC